MTDTATLSEKALTQLAALVNTLAVEDALADGWEEQLHHLTPSDLAAYLDGDVESYVAELVRAIVYVRDGRQLERRDSPVDFFGSDRRVRA